MMATGTVECELLEMRRVQKSTAWHQANKFVILLQSFDGHSAHYSAISISTYTEAFSSGIQLNLFLDQ